MTFLFAIASIGCSSSDGEYTSYVDGSRLGVEAQTHEASASLSKNEFPDSKKPYYSFELTFGDGPRRYLRINTIQDGHFRKISKNEVELIVTRKDKMLPESDDALLQESIDVAQIKMKYSSKKTAVTGRGEGPLIYKITHYYLVTVDVYNSSGQVLGSYEEKLVDSADTYMFSSETPPSPTGVISDTFDWMMKKATR